jgi:threonine/homoserine/homoserine lactone efflux protein
MLTFAGAVLFLLITPGPGVLSVAGVGSGFGTGAAGRYLTGLFLGTNLVSALVIGGGAALFLAVPAIRVALLAASMAYLLYLAFRIAFAGSRVGFAAALRAPGFRDGVALQLMNPKAYAVNTTLFSGFGFLPADPGLEIALKLLIMNAIWVPVHLAWLALGAGLRRLDLPYRTQRPINAGMAAAMVIVVALAVLAQVRGPGG